MVLSAVLCAPAAADQPDPVREAVALERRIEAGGETADLLRQLAAAWEAADDPDEAANALDRVVRVDPGDLRSRRQLAELREALGHQEDALRGYTWLAARLPDDVALWQAVGRIQAARGRDAEAAAAFERALVLVPGDESTLAALSDVYGWLGRDADRAAILERLLARRSGDRAARAGRARTLVRLERVSEAADELERLCADAPDDLESLAAAAGLDEAAGQEDRELAHRERLRALGDSDTASTRRLARLELDRGDLAAAKPLIDELTESLPDDPMVRIAKIDLDLQTRPLVRAGYRTYVTRREDTAHLTEASVEVSPASWVRLRATGGYGYREGPLTWLGGAHAEYHEGTALAGATFTVARGTNLSASADVDAYRDLSPFFGVRLGLDQRWLTTLDLRVDLVRRLDATTTDAVADQTSVHEARLVLDWEPVRRLLVRVEGGIGDWRHTDPATGERVRNLGGDAELGVGYRVMEAPIAFDVVPTFAVVVFQKSDGDNESFPYFAPSEYDTLGVELEIESVIGWRLRWGVRARPYWARTDGAFLVTYGGFVEVRLHPRHVLRATFDRTDTLAGAAALVYNENDVQATYTAIVW